jgi:hypothetical protein
VTREVMDAAPTREASSGPTVDFDLGELQQAPIRPEEMPREPFTIRLASWRSRRTPWWRAVVFALVIAVVGTFAGWQVGADRARSQVEAWISAHPPLVGWIVDNGADLASKEGDAREDVELHLLNVGRDPVIVRSISATTDGAPVNVDLNSYTPAQIPTGGTTIASLVLRTGCSSEYSEAALAVQLTRFDPTGDGHSNLLTVAQDPSLGQSMSEVLNGLCANPTRDQPDAGVDGVSFVETSAASGATVTVTNNSNGLRQVELSSEGSPSFDLVQSLKGPQMMQPGATLSIRLQVHLLECDAIGGFPDWASSLTLKVGRPSASFEGTANAGTVETYSLPDVLLVPGGAAIQKVCTS